MARLSKRGFNNVVIFAMLGMIFLFNLDRFVPESQSEKIGKNVNHNNKKSNFKQKKRKEVKKGT